MLKKIINGTKNVLKGTSCAVSSGLMSFWKHPQILVYPYLAAVFILLTFPVVNGVVFQLWNAVAPESILSDINATPEYLRILLGLVTFSVFYTIFTTAYFTVAMSAGAMASLEGKQTSTFYGLRLVGHNFLRVSMFSLLAIFFFPLAIIAQRKKLFTRDFYSVIGRSLSVNMAQLAPVILTEKKSFFQTINHSVETLGRAWKENLIIKIGTWILIFLILSIGFLPSLLADNWVDADTSQLVGSLTAILLSFAAYVVTKVMGSVFTTTLYYQALHKKIENK